MVGTSQQALGIPFVGFAVGVISGSVVYGWLHYKTGGSVWTAVFFHWVYTFAGQVVASGLEPTRSARGSSLAR